MSIQIISDDVVVGVLPLLDSYVPGEYDQKNQPWFVSVIAIPINRYSC